MLIYRKYDIFIYRKTILISKVFCFKMTDNLLHNQNYMFTPAVHRQKIKEIELTLKDTVENIYVLGLVAILPVLLVLTVVILGSIVLFFSMIALYIWVLVMLFWITQLSSYKAKKIYKKQKRKLLKSHIHMFEWIVVYSHPPCREVEVTI